jgi:hypothetical protein
MSAVAQLIAAGVQVEALPDGQLRASGNLTDTTRALIRANKPEILAELAANDPGIDSPIDPDAARRPAKALALLDEEPSRRVAVVAEAPKPGEAVGHVCTAVRHVAVGDITIPADKYDAFALMALMEQHEGKLQ